MTYVDVALMSRYLHLCMVSAREVAWLLSDTFGEQIAEKIDAYVEVFVRLIQHDASYCMCGCVSVWLCVCGACLLHPHP
jgi:hypothetical protein